LRTNIHKGIDAAEVDHRREVFGRNYIEQKPLTPFWVFCYQAMQDATLIFLTVASCVSVIIGSVFEPPECLGWLDGCAIMVAVIVVVLVGAIQESSKEKQFRALTDKAGDDLVNVIRGGLQVRISNRDVVVGDVVVLSTGDIIVADGLVFERNTLKIFEGALTGESHAISKGPFEFKERGHFEVPSDLDLRQMNTPGNTPEERAAKYEPTPDKTPLVFKGTEVQDGEGKMLVIAVGTNTYEQILLGDKEDDDEEGNRSILQMKLDAMTILITKVGALFGIGILIVLLIRFGVLFSQQHCCKETWDNSVHSGQIVSFFITAITIFVVAVPEGLPLAVTIALAFSVMRMMTDQCMVKTSSACETMGSATTICSDKTGTLTTSMMTVMQSWVCGNQCEPSKVKDTYSAEVKKMVSEAMIINSSEKTDIVFKSNKKQVNGVEVEEPVIDPNSGKYMEAYSGNSTECAMFKFVNQLNGFAGNPGDASMPYKSIRESFPESADGRAAITFSSKRKRMSTLVPWPGGGFRLFTKGASEMVMTLCTTYMDADGSIKPLDDAKKKELEESVINQFANQGLRTISVAYRHFETTPADNGVLPETTEADLTMVCIVGIEDPLRPEVPAAVQTCRDAGIVVRMVTGDNLATAKAISRKAGILDPAKEASGEELAMTGEQFRTLVLSDQNSESPERCIIQSEIDKIWPKLRVLARSTPTDKLVLVTGIQKSRMTVDGYTRQVVAVTGDGTNDAPALKQADVGFAMYINGTQVAQQAADIVILDDNFQSIVAAVKWGRCVYDNICKFLQFQLTVNITACTIAVVGAAVLTESPLKVIQLLWVNLIMDSFASLALATDDPNRVPGLKEQLLNRKPYARTQALLSKIMVRNMFVHALWQLLVLFLLIFAVGDVCERGDTIDTCSIVYWQAPIPTGVRSGRPIDYDGDYYPSDVKCVLRASPSCPRSLHSLTPAVGRLTSVNHVSIICQ
jgi:Ca2+ transporting ATPase